MIIILKLLEHFMYLEQALSIELFGESSAYSYQKEPSKR
jgi:hypothetical protein